MAPGRYHPHTLPIRDQFYFILFQEKGLDYGGAIGMGEGQAVFFNMAVYGECGGVQRAGSIFPISVDLIAPGNYPGHASVSTASGQAYMLFTEHFPCQTRIKEADEPSRTAAECNHPGGTPIGPTQACFNVQDFWKG